MLRKFQLSICKRRMRCRSEEYASLPCRCFFQSAFLDQSNLQEVFCKLNARLLRLMVCRFLQARVPLVRILQTLSDDEVSQEYRLLSLKEGKPLFLESLLFLKDTRTQALR